MKVSEPSDKSQPKQGVEVEEENNNEDKDLKAHGDKRHSVDERSESNDSEEEDEDGEPQEPNQEQQPNPPSRDIARSWPRSKKLQVTYLASLYKFVASLATSAIAPALPAIAKDFGTPVNSHVLLVLPLSTYFLGYVIGLPLHSALADTFGRIRTLQVAHFTFLIFNTASGFAPNNGTLIALRVLGGVGGSAALALGGAILRDCWTQEDRTKMITVYTLPATVGPALGPIMGAFATTYLSWPWVFWIISIASAVVQLLGVVFLRNETYVTFIDLEKQERKEKPINGTAQDNSTSAMVFKVLKDLRQSFARPFKIWTLHGTAQLLAVYSGFCYGLIYLAITAFHEVWQEGYGQPLDLASLNYFALAAGFILGSVGIRYFNVWVTQKIAKKRKDAGDETPISPESRRLPALIIGASLLPIGFLFFGWTANARLFPVLPDIGTVCFAAGTIIILQFTNLYIVDCYEAHAAAALSGVNTVRLLAGFALPLVAHSLFDALGFGWGNSLLALLCVVVGWPLPLLIWRYGPRLRQRDEKYEMR